MSKFLIFANGEPNDGLMVQRALEAGRDAHVVAADGGARVARYFGLTPHTIIGDMDSIPPHELMQLERGGAQVLRYPVHKDETDLELCLQFAQAQGAAWLRVIGGIGGRFDQVLANAFLLASPLLAGCDAEMVAGAQAIRLLTAGAHTLHGAVGDTLSLVPIGVDVTGICTEGLFYPLRKETLRFGTARGVSNVFTDVTAQVRFDSGLLVVVHTVGKAE